jgi:lipoate-protein ligase B
MGNTVDWGRTHYQEAWSRQMQLVAEVRERTHPETLVFTEHSSVYTLGARKGAIQHLLLNEGQLAEQGIDLIQSNRGGDITYHGPGQLVGYPILRLGDRKRDLHAYLRGLESVLIKTLASFGIESDRRKGMTGIWVDNRKIAAIGVAVKAWTTYHGFALNVDLDLSPFKNIIPCGIVDGSVTSMQQECPPAPLLGMLKNRLSLEFWNYFGEVS